MTSCYIIVLMFMPLPVFIACQPYFHHIILDNVQCHALIKGNFLPCVLCYYYTHRIQCLTTISLSYIYLQKLTMPVALNVLAIKSTCCYAGSYYGYAVKVLEKALFKLTNM